MKILHVCLAAFYIEGYAYQENVLPRMHKMQGHDVQILASCETFIDNQKLGYIEPSSYINEDGIPVTRLPYVSYLPLFIAKKLRIYCGVDEYLEKFQPDFIFLHDVQFLSLKDIIDYRKKNPLTTIVADGHTDYINSARNFVSKNILHRMIYKPVIRRADQYIKKYYGTLPSRVDFYTSMYKIPSYKVEYLPLGIDDNKIKSLSHNEERAKIINKYNIPKNDLIVVTGGKFDYAKRNIIELVKAVKELNNVSLIVFGSFNKEIKNIFDSLASPKVHYIGWLNEIESMETIIGCDLAVFPFLHSTLWEQSAGCGIPLLVNKITGFQHINICDNCVFLDSCAKEEIKNKLVFMIEKIDLFKKNAENAKSYFEYSNIAEKVLSDNL